MPDSLAQLQSLTTLVLARNQFTVFPPSILGLPKLKQLDLEYNQLKELPTEIGNLSTLETLNLANNELEALPEGIGKLTKLRKLLLNNNKIAELPAADCLDWQNLEELFLNKNRLHVLFHGKFLSCCRLAGETYFLSRCHICHHFAQAPSTGCEAEQHDSVSARVKRPASESEGAPFGI